MATNGILDIDIQETEDFRDPEMEISPEEQLDIIRTLTVMGVNQENYGEFTEEFRIWKQNNNGTFDMFLEEKYELPPGTITKIKTEKQIARGPEDIMQTEDEMTIQPGSGDMLEIMQSVGAPQRAARPVIDPYGTPQGETPIPAAQGGRIGYQAGEQVLPMPRPTEEDPRAGFFRRMGAMPEQTLLRQPQSMNAMNAMSGQMGGPGIMGATQDPFGGLLEGDVSGIDDAGLPGQPLGEYEHEGAEQPPSWWERIRTGTHDGSLDHSLDMDTIIDFLKKMGMAITKENIAKAAEALGMAMKFGSVQGIPGLGIAGLKSLGAPEEIEETETETIGFRDGGITNAVPRQGFFLGKAVKAITGGAKKIFKTAKKVLKSDLGKAAMLYLATAGASNYMAGAPKGWNWRNWVTPEAFKSNLGTNWEALTSKIPYVGKTTATTAGTTAGATGLTAAETAKITALDAANNIDASSAFWSDKIPFLNKGKEIVKAGTPWYKNPLVTIPGAMLAGGAYTAANPADVQFDTGKRDEEVNKWTQWLAGIPPADDIVYPYPDYTGAQGGRVGAQEGGIMNLGGMEKDYRNTGGFVDIGAKEKADDVPARLSVNEFVMTADAVRGAGDGDVEEGAERLQNTMKQLEQKGMRHKAAQGMFATSQRLGEVI